MLEPPIARPSVVEVGMTALGFGLTLGAGIAGGYASGFHLTQPMTQAHIVPLGVIVVAVVVGGLLGVEQSALRRDRAAPLVVVAGAATLAGVLVLVLRPTAGLSTPIGPALPWLVVSLVGVLMGAVALLLVLAARRRRGVSAEVLVLPVGTARGLLAVASALCLIVALGVAAQHLSSGFLQATNEYRENPIGSTGPPARSTLDGGVLWAMGLGPVPRLPALTTPYGIVVTQARAVTELDPSSGRVRWRYQRSDVDQRDEPEVWAIDGGRRLAVRWLRSGFFVLDARTGARVTRWPSGYATDAVKGADPTLLQDQRAGADRTTMTAVSDRGDRQWRYTTPTCQYASGVRTITMALVQVNDSCGSAQRLLGLDPRSGRQRWAVDHGLLSFRALTDTTAVTTDANGTYPTSLTGIDTATGATRWQTAIRAGGRPCLPGKFVSQGDSVAVVCDAGPLGRSSQWVLRYDVETGRLLDSADLGSTQVVQSATITADGRVVVLAESRRSPTCPVTVVRPDGTQATLPNVPVDSACIDTVQAVGDQVLVVNVVTGQVQALR